MVCRHYKSGSALLTVLVLAVAFFGQISAIFAQESAKSGSMPTADQLAKSNITYEVIVAEGGSFGYDVFADGKKLIHQPNIPGQPGTAGFKSRMDAEKVAKLVIRKIKNREIAPAVTEQELRNLKVIE